VSGISTLKPFRLVIISVGRATGRGNEQLELLIPPHSFSTFPIGWAPCRLFELPFQEKLMAHVAKIIELVAESNKGFDEAVREGLEVASKSIRGISGIDVKNMTCKVADNKITSYKVTLHVAFGIER
jgi:flavin-binding protein dodecin